jgi:lipoprotein-releasing system ATP-binding protein
VLSVRSVKKQYETPRGVLSVLTDITFSLSRGDAVSVMGPSGSGKSTLLYILGTLEPPTTGSVSLDGQDPFSLDDQGLAMFRNRQVGFVFQDHCLLPQCSVLENVLIPTLVKGSDDSGDSDLERARQLIDQVGLAERIDHLPSELSGGEKQRVAVARALIRKPVLLLCDEPTGNLDGNTSEAVGSLLLDLHRRLETILVVVTHSTELGERFQSRFEMDNGRLRSL